MSEDPRLKLAWRRGKLPEGTKYLTKEELIELAVNGKKAIILHNTITTLLPVVVTLTVDGSVLTLRNGNVIGAGKLITTPLHVKPWYIDEKGERWPSSGISTLCVTDTHWPREWPLKDVETLLTVHHGIFQMYAFKWDESMLDDTYVSYASHKE